MENVGCIFDECGSECVEGSEYCPEHKMWVALDDERDERRRAGLPPCNDLEARVDRVFGQCRDLVRRRRAEREEE